MKTILLLLFVAFVGCESQTEEIKPINPTKEILSKEYFVEFDITNEAYIDIKAATDLLDDNSAVNDTTYGVGYYAPYQYNFTSNKVRNLFFIVKIRAIRQPSKLPVITIKVDGNVVCCDTAFKAGTYEQHYAIIE